MSPTLAAQHRHIPYQPSETVEQRIGRLLGGLSEGTVKQLMKQASPESLVGRLVVVCRELIVGGDRPRADRIAAPLFALFSSAPAPVLSDELLLQETESGADVIRLRERFALNRTFANRRALMRGLQRDESREHALCLALDGLGDQ